MYKNKLTKTKMIYILIILFILFIYFGSSLKVSDDQIWHSYRFKLNLKSKITGTILILTLLLYYFRK